MKGAATMSDHTVKSRYAYNGLPKDDPTSCSWKKIRRGKAYELSTGVLILDSGVRLRGVKKAYPEPVVTKRALKEMGLALVLYSLVIATVTALVWVFTSNAAVLGTIAGLGLLLSVGIAGHGEGVWKSIRRHARGDDRILSFGFCSMDFITPDVFAHVVKNHPDHVQPFMSAMNAYMFYGDDDAYDELKKFVRNNYANPTALRKDDLTRSWESLKIHNDTYSELKELDT